MTSVLISGASIAGPALAYWLRHYGYDVTIVEKADALRGGGYPIDIRGTALDVVDRMGLLPALREAHVHTRKISFLNPDGSVLTSFTPDTVPGIAAADLEIRRGDLATILYGTIRDDVEMIFNDSIASLDDRGDGVDITFASGTRRTFDDGDGKALAAKQQRSDETPQAGAHHHNASGSHHDPRKGN